MSFRLPLGLPFGLSLRLPFRLCFRGCPLTGNRSGIGALKQLAEEIMPHIFVRAEDRVMILPPNQVYSLNDSAVRVLVFLERGGDLSRLPESFSDPGQVMADLETLFSGIRTLLKREENPAHIPWSRRSDARGRVVSG